MITKKEAAILGRLTRNLIHAEVEYSWRGKGDRETVEWAEENRKKARKRYFDYLKKITEKDALPKVKAKYKLKTHCYVPPPIDYENVNDPRVHGE